MTDQIQIWKRTDPGAPASIQPPYGATALRIVEARDGMDPSPDIFAADDDGKALLAYLLLYLENGVSTIAPRDHATLGVSRSRLLSLPDGWNKAEILRIYRATGGGVDYAVVFLTTEDTWAFGWRSIGATVCFAEREVHRNGPLAMTFDQEMIDKLRVEWGLARAAPGGGGHILDVGEVEFAGPVSWAGWIFGSKTTARLCC